MEHQTISNLLNEADDSKFLSRKLNIANEATNIIVDIVNTDNFNSFKYKTKLLENTGADGANRILRNATIAVPLKYLSNIWKSLEMPLINCKVELKLKWTKYCVLSALCFVNDNVNDNLNGNDITFTIKDTKLYVPVVTLTARGNQKLSKLLRKGFERSIYWNEYKIKSETKTTSNEFSQIKFCWRK